MLHMPILRVLDTLEHLALMIIVSLRVVNEPLPIGQEACAAHLVVPIRRKVKVPLAKVFFDFLLIK